MKQKSKGFSAGRTKIDLVHWVVFPTMVPLLALFVSPLVHAQTVSIPTGGGEGHPAVERVVGEVHTVAVLIQDSDGFIINHDARVKFTVESGPNMGLSKELNVGESVLTDENFPPPGPNDPVPPTADIPFLTPTALPSVTKFSYLGLGGAGIDRIRIEPTLDGQPLPETFATVRWREVDVREANDPQGFLNLLNGVLDGSIVSPSGGTIKIIYEGDPITLDSDLVVGSNTRNIELIIEFRDKFGPGFPRPLSLMGNSIEVASGSILFMDNVLLQSLPNTKPAIMVQDGAKMIVTNMVLLQGLFTDSEAIRIEGSGYFKGFRIREISSSRPVLSTGENGSLIMIGVERDSPSGTIFTPAFVDNIVTCDEFSLMDSKINGITGDVIVNAGNAIILNTNITNATGSAIKNAGRSIILNSILSDNGGVGILNRQTIDQQTGLPIGVPPTAVIGGSTIQKNFDGGVNSSGKLFMVDSAVVGNLNTGIIAGALAGASVGPVTKGKNLTISGNGPSFNGPGGISNFGLFNRIATMTLNNVIVTNNTGVGVTQGGGIRNNDLDSILEISNSIVAGNFASPGQLGRPSVPDVFGPITSLGHNLFGDLSGSTINVQATDKVGEDPLLDSLNTNGGPTPTHALLPGSPAIDMGSPLLLSSAEGACTKFDQRSVQRTEEACDIGAFELVSISSGTIVLAPDTAANPVGTTHTVTATVTDAGGLPVHGVGVDFSVTGINGGLIGRDGTNPNGEASFTYTGVNGIGQDTIQATFIDSNGEEQISNIVTKDWVPVTIGLAPTDATNPLGTSHTVTALLQNANTGDPIEGVTLNFDITQGPNTGFATGTGVTDAAGETTFAYTGNGGVGTDTIRVFLAALDGQVIAETTAAKSWTPIQITLSPETATNPENTPHTVTAFVQDENNTPVEGVSLLFTVLDGPTRNVFISGILGGNTTDANGEAPFTYAGTGGLGTDRIQAAFTGVGGEVLSNIVTKEWITGPALVTVPDVVGLAQSDAEAAIVAAGLTVGDVQTANSDTVPAGDVSGQNPTAGTEVASGSAVELVVSLGPAPVTVPDVAGLTQEDAEFQILLFGLEVGTVTFATNPNVPEGSVISQSPVGGETLPPGSVVDLVISGPSSVTKADLAVVKLDTPDPVFVGQVLTYSMTVTNNGPNGASGVTLIDTLEPNVEIQSVTSSQGTCSTTGTLGSGFTIICALGDLAINGTAMVTIQGIPQIQGTLENTASVTGDQEDSEGNNNTATVVTTVSSESTTSADLSVVKIDTPDPVKVGQPLTYTLTVTNNGPNGASGITLTDPLPAGLNVQSAISSQGSCTTTGDLAAGFTVTCSLGELAINGTAMVSIVAVPQNIGVITNTATVFGDQRDPDEQNNTAMAATTVTMATGQDLSIESVEVIGFAGHSLLSFIDSLSPMTGWFVWEGSRVFSPIPASRWSTQLVIPDEFTINRAALPPDCSVVGQIITCFRPDPIPDPLAPYAVIRLALRLSIREAITPQVHGTFNIGLGIQPLDVIDKNPFDNNGVLIVKVLPPSLPTIKDSFIQKRNINRNEGANTALVVAKEGRNRIRTVVGFDLSNVANAITKATLSLTIAEPARGWGRKGREVNAHHLLDSFTEGNGFFRGQSRRLREGGNGPGVTWHCATDTNIANRRRDCEIRWRGGDLVAESATDSVLITNRQTGDVSWDVTTDVQAALAEGVNEIQWLLRKARENRNGKVEFYSKEGAEAANDPSLAPRLILEFDGE